MKIQSASLRVRDLAAQQRFYTEVLGFQDWGEGWLGTAERAFLQLLAPAGLQAAAPDRPGLFHLAVLLPGRPELASWLALAAARGLRLEGASDHNVSEALYLRDPEGNGLEFYWDRQLGPMTTERLDLQDLLREARPLTALPRGSGLGHIHLQHPDLITADWLIDQLGLQQTQTYPGARFLAAGDYHHHFAVNQWQVHQGRPGLFSGLAAYHLSGDFQAAQLLDPWGHEVQLTASARPLEAGQASL